MSGKRSPNCPAHNLEESIDKVSAIYRIEGRNSFPGAVAVAHMGYNGLNGASRRALGAVRAFGLLEGRGEQLRVSDDAVLIIADAEADDQQERDEALLRALCHNRVFSDIYHHFSDQAALNQISGFLQKKYRFKPVAADSTAEVYRSSVSMLLGNAAQPEHDEISGDEIELRGSASLSRHATGITGEAGNSRIPTGSSQDARRDSFSLENGTACLSWPVEMSAGEFEDFTDWLILEHRKISRKVQGGNGPAIERRNDKPESR